MCCSSKESVFTWLSALLVNVAFLSLITWGADEFWPIGMGLSTIYTLIILAIASRLDSKQRTSASIGTAALHDEDDEEYDEGNPTTMRHSRIRKIIMDDDLDLSILSLKEEEVSSLVNLLYFLSVVSLGVTGFFLVVNLIPSCDNPIFSISHPLPPSRYTWQANLDTIPSSVQDWATSENLWLYPEVSGSFAYVPSSGVTLFRGSGYDAHVAEGSSPSSYYSRFQEPASSSYLWMVRESSPPVLQEGFSFPGAIVTVSDDAVCFPAIPSSLSRDDSTDMMSSKQQRKDYAMYCSNGLEFHQETFNTTDGSEAPAAHGSTLKAFYPVDGTLWYKEILQSNVIIYSLDPKTMVSTLHSINIQDNSSHTSATEVPCDIGHLYQVLAIVSLLASVLPMIGLTFLLGKKKKIPSMGIAAYINISLAYVCLNIFLSPNEIEDLSSNFHIWFAISGLVCLLFSTYLLLTLRQEGSNAPRWVEKSHEKQCRSLLGVSAVAFAWGTSMVLADIFDQPEYSFGWWLLYNTIVCMPLLLFGAASDSTFLLAIGGLGFLANAAQLASLIDSALFFFAVFALMGLLVGTLGYYFAVQLQPIIQKWAQAQVARINDQYCDNNSDPYGFGDDDYDEDYTSPLATSTDDPTVRRLILSDRHR